jgi:kynurenine formamidase
VKPQPLGEVTAEAPSAAHASSDRVLTRTRLATAAAGHARDPWTALVVRTLPNGPDKRQRVYEGDCPAPYFTADAMHWVVERGVTSLVVDLPSLDRAQDGGVLTAHRIFWGRRARRRSAGAAAARWSRSRLRPRRRDGLHC